MRDNPYEPPETQSESSGDSIFNRPIAAWWILIALITACCHILSVAALEGSIGSQIFAIMTIVLVSILFIAFVMWLVKR